MTEQTERATTAKQSPAQHLARARRAWLAGRSCEAYEELDLAEEGLAVAPPGARTEKARAGVTELRRWIREYVDQRTDEWEAEAASNANRRHLEDTAGWWA